MVVKDKVHANFKKYVVDNIKGKVEIKQSEESGQVVRDYYYNNFESFRANSNNEITIQQQNEMEMITIPRSNLKKLNISGDISRNEVNLDQTSSSIEEYKEEIQELYNQKLQLQDNMKYQSDIIRRNKRAILHQKKGSIINLLEKSEEVKQQVDLYIGQRHSQVPLLADNQKNISLNEVYHRKKNLQFSELQSNKSNAVPSRNSKSIYTQDCNYKSINQLQKEQSSSSFFKKTPSKLMVRDQTPCTKLEDYQMPLIITRSSIGNFDVTQQRQSRENQNAQSETKSYPFNQSNSLYQEFSNIPIPQVKRSVGGLIFNSISIKGKNNNELQRQSRDIQCFKITQLHIKSKQDLSQEVRVSENNSLESSPLKKAKRHNRGLNNQSLIVEHKPDLAKGKLATQQSLYVSRDQQKKKPLPVNPQTFKIHKNYTKRIWFQRRQAMINQPLLILVFDGLMGVFHKNLENEIELFIRSSLIEGLNILSSQFQIIIYTSIRDEAKIKFLIQCLRKRKVEFDAVYRKLGNESIFDNYDQLFIDFMINVPIGRSAIVSPYYSQDGDQVIHSYQDYGNLHTMFRNICVREKFDQFEQLPLQILVPHYLQQSTDFIAIGQFIVGIFKNNPQRVIDIYDHIKRTQNRKQKHFYICESKKLSFEYMISHQLLLFQKQDQTKIEQFLQNKEQGKIINAGQQLASLPKMQQDCQPGIYVKHLKELRNLNEQIRMNRLSHCVQYYKRMSKQNRNMRREVIREGEAKGVKASDLNEYEDIDQIIAKVQDKANHKFIIMRNIKGIQYELEKLDSMISSSQNLSIIDWLSKKQQ